MTILAVHRRSHLSHCLKLALSGIALHSGHVYAQTALPAVSVKADSEPVSDYGSALSTVGGKTPTALRDIAQSVTVVNEDLIKAQGTSSLAEALRNVPGITLSAGEGGAIGDSINLRGFSARTDLFIDGMRDRGQYTRDTFFLNAVEVLKGPSSMLFGRGSTGGVINQVSKKPQLAPVSELGVAVGTNDFKRTTVDVGRATSDTSAFRVASFWQEAGSDRDVVDSRRYGIAPSLRFGINTPTEVTLSALLQRGREVPDYGFPFLPTSSAGVGTLRRPVDAPSNRYYGYTDDRFDQNVGVFSATVKHKLNTNWTVRNQLQIAKYNTKASPSPLGAISLAPGAPIGTALDRNTPLSQLQAVRQDRDREIDDESIFNQTDLIGKFKTGNIDHTLVTGFEIGRDDYDNDRYVWTTTAGQSQVNLGNPINGMRQGSRSLNQTTTTRANSYAAYINDQVDLNKQWKLVGGIRYDRFQASQRDINQISPAAGLAQTDTTLRQTDNMFSYRTGAIYQPTDIGAYYLSYGTSFNPSAETVTLTAANTGVAPEKSRSMEIGGKWDLLQGDLSLNTALFRIDKNNARTTDPVNRLVSVDGRTRVDGFEITAIGRLTRLWNVIAGYTRLSGKVRKSNTIGTTADAGLREEGNALLNTPKNSATLWTTYLLGGHWEVGGGLVYSDDKYVNNFQTAQIDGYTRYDATLAYREKKYDVRLNLQNLTDERYFDVASGGRATLAQGRAAKLSLNYRF
jgi:catecholate siderophore receptor